MTELEYVNAADGTRLACHGWRGPSERERASVLLVHGAGEHAGRWTHVCAQLAERGLSVSAPDLRGHGLSEGPRGHVRNWEQFLTDLEGHLAELRDRNLPVVLYGHSLGGLIALAHTLSGRHSPDMLILSAPLIEVDVPTIKRLAARILSGVAPLLRLSPEITGPQLSRDPSVGEAYFSDPLVLTKLTTRLGAETLRAMNSIPKGPLGLPPTLVIHGGDDTLVPTKSSEFLARSPGVERTVFPGFRHEIHNEENGHRAIATVGDWIENQLAPRSE